jgi:DNA invertase Pin-like site-specific DNA recombinase
LTERAWIFAAVSSSPQEATLEQQRTWGQEVAAANGWTVERVFEGVGSGALGPRELLSDLISELRALPKARRPARVLMVRLDRVGRQALDCIASVAELRRLGVTLHTREEGDLKLNAAMDSLRPIFALVTAQLENEARSDKWKAVHARRRAAGLHQGIVPFGVVLIDGKAVPYEPEAAIVRELFAKATDGWGYARLARWAKERAPVKRQSDGTDRPLSWAPSTVKSILWGKTARSVLVDDATVARMEAARQSDFRARAPRRWPWPLQGAVRCTCGKLLSGHASGESAYRTRYYICRWHGGEGSYPAHRADVLENAFRGVLSRLTAEPDVFIDRSKRRSVETLRARQTTASKRLETLERRRRRACELAEDGSLSGPQLRERLDEIDADRKATRDELERVRIESAELDHSEEQTAALRATLAVIEKKWNESPVELQQAIARAVAAGLGGLYASPRKRGQLIVGAKFRKSDDSITKKFIQSITE